jgi:hypothetical protein
MAIDSGVNTQIKEHYDSDIYKIIFEPDQVTSPLFAMCEAKKIKDGFGRNFVTRVVTHEGSAVAADPDIADDIAGDGAAGGRPGRDRWVTPAISIDSPFTFDRDEVDAIEGKSADEQFDVITEEMDMAAVRLSNILAEQVANKGWGMLAQISAITSTTVTVPVSRLNRFPIGARLVASASEDTDVLLGTPAGAQLAVSSVNTSTGVITLSGNPQTTWTNSATLYLFRAGMRVATDPSAAQSAKTALTGLSAWIDPDSTSFMGVTRTGNPVLTGYSFSASGLDTAAGLIGGADTLFHFGRKMGKIILCSGTSWKLLQQDYDAAKVVQISLGEYKIGFTGFKLATVFGDAVVVPDPFILPGEAYVGPFNDKKWGPKLYHAGKNLVNLDDLDGKQFERRTDNGSRSFKGQFYYRGNMVIPAPGQYLKISNLPTS